MEEFDVWNRAAIDLFENLVGIGALDLEAVMSAIDRLAVRAAVGARVVRQADFVLADCLLESHPVGRGRAADKIFEKVNGGPVPDVKFFHVDWINVGSGASGRCVTAWQVHPGWKSGDLMRTSTTSSPPFSRRPRRGREPSRRRKPSLLNEHAGIRLDPLAVPGIYTGDGMLQEYRDWLGADSYEAIGSIGGSFVSDKIEDYYVNPFELGYGFYIGWKSDFIGKDALLKMKDGKNRKKVTLEWNRDDVLKVVASSFEEGTPYKWIDFPQPNYASTSADS